MSKLGRRHFLKRGGAVAAASSLPLSLAFSKQAKAANPWGPLAEQNPGDPMAVPPGFTVTVLQSSGAAMSDGYRVPTFPDGMAAFSGAHANEVVLMRNHEIRLPDDGVLGGDPEPPEMYQPGIYGSVTRLVVDTSDMSLVSSNLVLLGSSTNCAGGPSPWGWLSCEETTAENHGYVFLCDATAETIQMPNRIDGYGRFKHEAVAIDPSNNQAYLTEDEGDSALYRFVPSGSDPFTGELQAMRVVGMDNFDMDTLDVDDTPLEIDWVTIADASDDPYSQAAAQGAARITRGEGIWFHEGAVYVCSTTGGAIGKGQIFRVIDDASGRTVECLANSSDVDVLDMPDNICVHPTNGQVFMAEDGDAPQYLRYIDAEGNVCDFAENIADDGELCGVCFSPDGRVLFVNLQTAGLTVAIEGPFDPNAAGDGDGDGDETGGMAGGEEEEGCACATDPAEPSTWGLVGLAASFVGLRGITVGPLGRQRRVTGWFLGDSERVDGAEAEAVDVSESDDD